MATITKTFTENQIPGQSGAKWTLAIAGTNLTAKGDTFTFKTPAITAKYSLSGRGYGNAHVWIKNFKIGGKTIPRTSSNGWAWYKPSSISAYTAMASGTAYTLTKGTKYANTTFDDHTKTLNTGSFFTASNKTTRTLNITTAGYEMQGRSANSGETSYNYWDAYSETASLGTVATLTLDAPPLLDDTHNTVSAISFDTPYVYAGLTTASVTVGNLSARYGGDITKVAFKIGSATVTRTTAGTLSIPLTEVGTFTPTVTFTDSRGQTSTKTLSAITVNGYNAPTVNLTCLRTNSAGVPNDEGQSAVVTANFGWTSALTSLSSPTVSVTDLDGNTVTTTTAWYSDSALTTPISNSDWATLTASDMPIYGLIDNSGHNAFNTQLSYQIAITPNDTQGSGATITQTLGAAFYTIDFLAGGHGIAFGQPATDPGFYCDMQANFVDKSDTMRALFDFIHPVGSYYETSDTTFDPNVTWGGTWVLEDEGLVHIGAGSNYTVGATGGAKTSATGSHKLTTDEIPAHTHGKETLTGYFSIRPYSSSGGNIVGTNGIVSADTLSSTSYNGVSGASSGTKYQKITIDASHTHTSVGGSGTHSHGSVSTMQPYIVVNRWHRTA